MPQPGMSKRPLILLGMALGALWAVAVVWGGRHMSIGFVPLPMVAPFALAVPGLVLILLMGRLAQRRFFDDGLIDGADFEPGSPGWIDQRVLNNTMEQGVLALLTWPFTALTLGGNVVLTMGVAFGIARLAFWIGYHASPSLRAFGFAATFYPTVLATLWALTVWFF